MKRTALPLAALLATAASSVLAADPPVTVDTRGLPHYLAKQVEAEAAKGVTPLRRYLERTYPVHQLRVDRVLAKEEPARFAKMTDHEKSPVGPAAGAAVALRGADADK